MHPDVAPYDPPLAPRGVAEASWDAWLETMEIVLESPEKTE